MSNVDLISTVQAHLKLISASVSFASDEASLRAITGSLRFLLSDGNLAQAWRETRMGGPMTFKVWCITATGPGPVVAFCGGGDMLPNMPFSACRGASLCLKTLDLHSFCRATRVQVDDVKISTTEVINYIANALGGAHFDPEGKAAKKPKGEILSKLESGEIIAVPLCVNDRSLLHHEILSIAQALVRSPEANSLLRGARGHL